MAESTQPAITASQLLTMGLDQSYLSKRPLPDAPTGYYDWQITVDPSDDVEGHSGVTNLVNRVQRFKAKGGFQPKAGDLAAFYDAIQNPQAVDDRRLAFATGLGILAKLDPYSDLSKSLNDTVIGSLYNTVPHPPASYLGADNSYRAADGGNNCLEDPNLGRAGTPYARSVQGKSGLPRTSLPDAGLLYDNILKRREERKHEGGMSSLIFAYASIVIHSLFRTDHRPGMGHINNASSYLDLSPLYGDNQAGQDSVRDKKAGRGLLYPDTFYEERLVFAPAASSVLLVLFSRNHNFIADKLLKINERKTWTNPPPEDERLRAIQDEQIFQTAKLINCGHFMSAIMGDYVAGFLGSSEGVNWNMNAFDEIKKKDLQVERGRGNHVSVEFNLLYRWHSTLSTQDENWILGVLNRLFPGKDPATLSPPDFITVAGAFAGLPEPSARTFAGLSRGPDGRFNDDDLARILITATSDPAGAFGGRSTPTALRLVEMMTIEQARAWGVCTMNEFRKFLGLRQFETFEEWNPDPAIAGEARRLYGHVDNLELYIGLQAESTMPLTPGSRFACGFTTTRAVLGDAIALVRGDRFFTSDFTPTNLTTWGFYDCQRDMNDGAGGSEIRKLLLRHLPRHYEYNSVYALYSFFTPEHMKESLTRQGIAHKYSFAKPVTLVEPQVLNTYTGIKAVFNDPRRFKVIYEKYGYGSILMFDEVQQHDNDKAMMLHALFPTKDSLSQFAAWFATNITQKIEEKSWSHPNTPGRFVDIVRDVINVVSTHVTADKLTGIDLKTKQNPSGTYTENELYDMLISLFDTTFMIFDDVEHSFALHEAATASGLIVGGLTAKSLIRAAPSSCPSYLGSLAARVANIFSSPKSKDSYPFLSNLAATGRPLDELLGNILGVAVGACVNFAHAAVHVIDFYMADSRAKERAEIARLSLANDANSDGLLRGYVREAMRLNPQFPGLWRKAAVDATIDQGPGLPPAKVQAGQRIWASFRNANLNPVDFPEPLNVDPTRPLASYNLNGAGFHNCPGTTYAQHTIAEIVKAVFKLKNLRRAPGAAGQLNGFKEIIHETETNFYIKRNGSVSAWPGSLVLVYDE